LQKKLSYYNDKCNKDQQKSGYIVKARDYKSSLVKKVIIEKFNLSIENNNEKAKNLIINYINGFIVTKKELF
jgi:hypothetical protein